jgi:hypothetical protein
MSGATMQENHFSVPQTFVLENIKYFAVIKLTA